MTSEKDNFLESNYFADTLFVFHKNHKDFLNHELAKYNISLIQASCIIKIYGNKGISQKDLAKDLYLTKGAITKAITKLESNGYIAREKSPEDKRYFVLNLTEQGEKLIPIMGEINEKWENELGLSDIDSSFLETFKELTSRAIDINKGKI
ncbi:MarR family winged helix-turn-helix transcriptional regulator [Methanobrevibacter sp.]|uniref:MarR family winged helix-turn-helix transcriptional regulator n=1 Tax=Methanobrevibacter sp. TaxID=66852 RepID=UPI0025FFADFB|nr:MarR family transcriptional regulator [Methanobrevibacter sp.]MBQ6512132.1 MarR family transcriptional regulator [Methanobrevibacter sp.]